MADYKKTTGSAGLGYLMIRDTGTDVEFYFRAGYSSDWWNGMPFNWTANGTTTSKKINYPTGRPLYKVGEVRVTKSQTVTFRLTDGSSASGIGGPTSFSVAIKRATVPAKPTTPVISSITATSVYATFSDGSNGGASINSRQIGYGTSSTSPQKYVTSDRSTTITGLSPGTTYYFWARTHNSEGYSAWSGRATAKTLKVPDAPTTPLLAAVRMTSVDVAFSANGNGGSSITGYEVGYSKTATGDPTSTVTAKSPMTLTGLEPGTTYFFRTRAKNSVGWSAWSSASSIKTIAGAYVKVGAVWKLAVPYVNVGGVWKLAEPWGKSVGVWKRTT
ncbi:hydrolase [Streptomyces phage Maya]|uniref:Hydrolase n=7 Tax=Rimavirus rima TaxID=2560784 RepID=A0A5J6D913_9CAUD|nr:hydrolase [Streptomyces phage Jaylociraptor]QEQ93806.1 hydrolase [Streptomyces phage CherryBlossom]QEQ93975.1 hydrolase [Streptomyces phage Meibysrarus]QGJ96726.1 hydrolase [Streptomyces phage FidgetOrca]QNN98192.1 hydrolase [Streptomyces phage Maya]QNN99502.1 hydrolase [Streptomyces phage TieDye]QWY81426.1 minor tail protein [Streptomyces phage TaidaOne]